MMSENEENVIILSSQFNIKSYEGLMTPLGGTFCPSCGLPQAHIHLGWGMFEPDAKILFTKLHCERCGHNSIIIRSTTGKAESIVNNAFEHMRRVSKL